ncbi:MAG: methyltransferase domain-containing protein [Chloroflexi bacterium]|nr:methyltransferase domain-containing protein [Chloroflexota bacterium]
METRSSYIKWARFYDVVVTLMSLGREPAFRKTTLELGELRPGQKLLDVGCGTGTLAILAKAKAGPDGEVHGIDASPEMIEVACRKADKAGADVRFQVGLFEDIPFPDDQFDLALSSLMLHHLPDELKREGFAEIYRVLKPGGRLLTVDFGAPSNSLISHLMLLFGHSRTQSNVQELMTMMEDAGFREVEAVQSKYRGLAFIRATVMSNRVKGTYTAPSPWSKLSPKAMMRIAI